MLSPAAMTSVNTCLKIIFLIDIRLDDNFFG